jgi:hypothetical protein
VRVDGGHVTETRNAVLLFAMPSERVSRMAKVRDACLEDLRRSSSLVGICVLLRRFEGHAEAYCFSRHIETR